MTVLTFPTNPQSGQQYDAPNQIQYVFDGVKWTVLTVASTSLAVTDAVQDRVAPMFVNGDHDGINFTYNAATNVLSASVTAVNGNKLVNGANELVLGTTGDVTLPNGGKFNNPYGDGAVNLSGNQNFYSALASYDTKSWAGAVDATYSLSNFNVAGGGFFVQTNINGIGAAPIWAFRADGALENSGSYTKITMNSLNGGVASQVVWTSTVTDISGAKLTIQVETDETGGVNTWETQVCEAVIAVRGHTSSSTPVISVYGVTHTSVAPLMIFTVDRNPTTSLIEITGTRTGTASLTSNAGLRIHSVETGTMD